MRDVRKRWSDSSSFKRVDQIHPAYNIIGQIFTLAGHLHRCRGSEHRGDLERPAPAIAAFLHRHPGPDPLHRAPQRRRLLQQVQVQLQLRGQRGGGQAHEGEGESGLPGRELM